MKEENSKFQDPAIAPMHTAEHILNQTMVRMFGCGRSADAHIERKKSKINYQLSEQPTDEQIEEIARRVNQVIDADMPVEAHLVAREALPEGISLERLPESHAADEQLRLVYIGDYDVCPCIGQHVTHTGALGHFHINSTSYKEGVFRIVFKLQF